MKILCAFCGDWGLEIGDWSHRRCASLGIGDLTTNEELVQVNALVRVEGAEDLTLAANIEDVRAEIEEVERLLVYAETVREQEIESRGMGAVAEGDYFSSGRE